MARQIHKPNPAFIPPSLFKTGNPPSVIGGALVHAQFRHLLNWSGQRQIFTFTGPGPYEAGTMWEYSPYRHLNPDYDYPGHPYFAVITRSDTLSTTPHKLASVVYPWRYGAGAVIAWHEDPAGVSVNRFTGFNDSPSDPTSVDCWGVPSEPIVIYGLNDTGATTGGFAWHKFAYEKMCIAGMAVWTLPDSANLAMSEPEWYLAAAEEFRAGRQVRGYETTRRGLGALIGKLGELKNRTNRCMLQSGHPTGVFTQSTTYVDLRDGSANRNYFKVRPKALCRGSNMECSPAIVASASGASEGHPAYVKFYSTGAGESCEIAITSDTEAMWTSPGGFLVAATGDTVAISMKAPDTGGCVTLRSYSLWEDT